MASATLNIATLAPVPHAIDRTAIAVSARLRANTRAPCLTSCQQTLEVQESVHIKSQMSHDSLPDTPRHPSSTHDARAPLSPVDGHRPVPASSSTMV